MELQMKNTNHLHIYIIYRERNFVPTGCPTTPLVSLILLKSSPHPLRTATWQLPQPAFRLFHNIYFGPLSKPCSNNCSLIIAASYRRTDWYVKRAAAARKLTCNGLRWRCLTFRRLIKLYQSMYYGIQLNKTNAITVPVWTASVQR
jgi:hypothetical protein